MDFKLAWCIAFLMGSLPSSLIVVRLMTGQDIRKLGSGNPGATNVFRTIGRKCGSIVLCLDVLKGFLSVACLLPLVNNIPFETQLFAFSIGSCSILGHVFSPWLKFKGGKGVATSAGVALWVYTQPLIIALIAWGIILKLTRIMSIASIASLYIFTTAVFILMPNKAHTGIALGCALFITWTHRANIKRLIQGNELKI